MLSQRSKYILNILLMISLIFIYYTPAHTSVANEYNSLQQQMEYEAQIDAINQDLPKEYQKKIHREILKEYKNAWNKINMDEKLKTCIHQALQVTKEEEDFWTKAKFIVSDPEKNRILSEIVINVTDCFTTHYENFTSELSINIEQVINKNIKESQTDLFKRKTNLNYSLPGGNGLIEASLEDSKTQFENLVKNEIKKKIENSEDMNLSVGDFSAAISGIVIKMVMSKIKKTLAKKAAGVGGSKLLAASVPGVGWVIAAGTIAWDGYCIGSDILHIPERIEEEVYAAMNKSYTVETPKFFSEECENTYLSQINQFIKFVKNFDSILLQLNACPTYINLCAGIDKDEQNAFAARLYRITSRTNNDICWIAEKLGATIKNLNEGNLLCLSELLNCTGPENINKWLKINKGEICYLLRNVPLNFICKLEPSIASIGIVKKFRNLNQRAKDVASQLNPEKIRWILSSLDSFYGNQILSSSSNIRHIEDTIDVMARLNPRILDENFSSLLNDYSIIQNLLTEAIPNDYKGQRDLIDREIIDKADTLVRLKYHINDIIDKIFAYKYFILITFLLFLFWKISRRTKVIKEVVIQNGEHQKTKIKSDNK